jgi:hypothetical protein
MEVAMTLVVLGIAVAALAAVILTLVAPTMERRRPVRNDGTGCADDGWSPGIFSSDGGSSDCSGADAGGCGGDGGGGGGD